MSGNTDPLGPPILSGFLPPIASPAQPLGDPEWLTSMLADEQDPAQRASLGEHYKRLQAQSQDREKLFLASWRDAVAQNPDLEARAQATAKTLGVPPEAVRDNLEVATAIAKERALDTEKMQRDNPVLFDQLHRTEFLYLAHDDLDALTTIDSTLGWLNRQVSAGAALNERGFLGVRDALGYGTDEDKQRLREIDLLTQSTSRDDGAVANTLQVLGQMADTMPLVLAAGTAAAAPVAALSGPASPVTAGGAFAFGAGTAMFTQTAMIEGGNAFLDMVEKGYSREAAARAAFGVGIVNGVLELAGAKAVSAPFRAAVFRKAVSGLLAGGLKKASAERAFGTFVKEYVKAGAAEVSTEVLQEAMSMLGEESARGKSRPDLPSITRDEAVDRLASIAWKTASAMSILGAPGPTLHYFSDMRRAADAKATGEKFTKLFGAAEKSKTRERSPGADGAFAGFAQEAAQGVPTLYVEAEKFQQAMRATGATIEQLKKSLPDVAEQLDTVAEGGDITIDTGKALAVLPGTDLGNALLPHLRKGADEISAVEAASTMERRQEMAKELIAKSETLREQNDAVDKSAKAVEEGTYQQLVKIPRMAAADARIQAKLHAAFATVMGAKEGKTPEQFVAENPLTVQEGKDEAAGEGAVAQLPPDHPSVAPHLKDSKLPFVVYHGTTAGTEFNEFKVRTEKRYEDEQLESAIFFGELAEADQFAGGQAGPGPGERPRVYPAYLRMTNPMIVDMQELSYFKVAGSVVEAIETAKKRGHDGVILKNMVDMLDRPSTQYLVFDHSQILSAVSGKLMQSANDLKEEVEKFHQAGNVHERDASRTPSEPPQEYKLTPEDAANLRDLREAVPTIAKLAKSLSPDEIALLTPARAKAMARVLKTLPEASEMAAVAKSGRAKRGWYARSAAALQIVFGADAHRFAALLAAMSPQTSVEANMINALPAWNAWVAAGRPQDERSILKILAASVQGSKTEKSVLGAWRDNAYRALTHPDPLKVILSGPKVNSFMLNLVKVMHEVANDAWMANYANVDQGIFSGAQAAPLPGKSPGYIAMSARTRQAAESLGWAPAEVQETVWSWAKALYEKAENLGRTALDVLTSGDLTHEDINSVPDFAQLFQMDAYKDILVAGGHEEKLAALQEAHEASASADTGSVYSGDARELLLLRRAASRLDALAKQRAFDAKRVDILVNLSASTGSIPGLDALTRASAAGDRQAEILLQEVAGDSLRYLTDGIESVKITTTPVTGLYAGDVEPALGVHLSFAERDRAKVLVALRKFAENFNQHQVHVRGDTVGAIGKTFPDGSFNTKVVRFNLKSPMSRADIRAVIDASGLPGLTAADNYLEAYYAGDPNDTQALQAFSAGIKRAGQSLGTRISGVGRGSARLWVYGHGSGAIDYGSIAGEFRAPKGDRASATAQRVASRLARHEVGGIQQATEITPAQRALQERIAAAFEAMKLDNLADPNVRRAYTELAAEVSQQFDAMPIKVEIWEAEGEPYGGDNRSAEMRQDVLANNHLWIFATVPDQFGPPGVTYDNHPLLADSGRDDVNGRPLLFNDLLRAVHDYYAHTVTPATFGPIGEEVAWRTHMEMTHSPWARWALTSETRGQNSWVNFRPGVEKMKLGDRGFSEQKVDLLPIEFVITGDPSVDASLSGLPGSEQLALEPVEQPLAEAQPAEAQPAEAQPAEAQPAEAQPAEAERPLAQGERSSPRGTFTPSTGTIDLNKTYDASTFLHELGHYFLTTLFNVAAGPNASASVKQDAQLVLDWFGVKDLAAWNALPAKERARLHEQWAYNHEIFLFEGKAPSVKLEGIFAKFTAWIRRVYREVTRINDIYKREFGTDLPALTPEVRGVMGRLVASDEQIAQAEAVRAMSPLFLTKEESGMTDEQWAAYQDASSEAHEAAVLDLTRASLRQMQWLGNARKGVLRDLQKQHDEIRDKVREEVAAEMSQMPVYRAREWLAKGKFAGEQGDPAENHKLNRAAVQAVAAGGRDTAAIDSLLADDGVSPDSLAPILGFESGDQMVRALLAAPDLKAAIDARTDRRMMAEHSEFTDPAKIEGAVELALHNEARSRFIATELRFLQKIAQPVRLLLQSAKAAAKQVLAGKRIRDIRPHDFALAEARAARAAEKASRSKKSEEAIAAKRQQLLQGQMAKQAAELRAEIDKAKKDFGRLNKPDSKLAKTRDVNIVGAARAILAKHGLNNEEGTASAFIEKLAAYNPDAARELAPLVRDAEQGPADHRDMTVEQFRMLRDTVDALWKRSKDEKQILIDGVRRDVLEATGELSARLREIGIPAEVAGERKAPTWRDKAMRTANVFKAVARRVEHWASSIDGSSIGPFTKLIFRPVQQALDKFRVVRNNYTKRFVELVTKLDLPTGEISGGREIPYTFKGKAELIGAMLHTGNLSNLEKHLVGRGWGTIDENGVLDSSQWDAFVDRMIEEGVLTEADFKFLQATWDLLEEIKPMLQASHFAMFGYNFTEVEAQPFTNKFGTFRGGYVPAKPDDFLVSDVSVHAQMQAIEEDFRQTVPSTGMGFTKERVVAYRRPLSIDVRKIAAHIDSSIRFAIVQPAIRDALKLIRNQEFADNLTRVDPAAITKMLLPWLARAARQKSSQPGLVPALDRFWNGLRTRAGIGILFANLTNAMQQLNGYFPSSLKVEGRYLKASLANYLRDYKGMSQNAADLSPFMADRLQNQIFDFADAINDTLLNPNKFQKLQKWSSRHGYVLQSAFQNQVDVVTWSAAFDQAMAEQNAQTTDEVAVKEAVARADAAVRQTQGGVKPEDVSAFEAGTPLMRVFTQFSGYFNMLANLNVTEFTKVLRDMGWRGNLGKLFGIYVFGFLAPMLISDAIVRAMGRGWDDDDDGEYLDDTFDWFFGGQLRGGLALLPFGSTIAVPVNAWNNKPYDDRMMTSPTVSAIENAFVGVARTGRNLIEKGEITGKNIKDTLTLLSLITGVPVSVLGRPLGYLEDVSDGKKKPSGPVDFARGLVTGR